MPAAALIALVAWGSPPPRLGRATARVAGLPERGRGLLAGVSARALGVALIALIALIAFLARVGADRIMAKRTKP